jgi:dienelactone hydrolase
MKLVTKILGAVLTGAIALASLQSAVARPFNEPVFPETVHFPSMDGHTLLTGYVFRPSIDARTAVPAVVMMHGRAGAYSSLADGIFDASTLSQRHLFWGRLWASQGYVAVLVDGFGPRGFPQGFPRFSYGSRPASLNEVTVRPFDAYGALAYLRSRGDVLPDRIGLQGWSNGGSATLASMAPDAPGLFRHNPRAGFRAAISLYPGCGLKNHFARTGYRTYAPLRVFVGTADEEISPRKCDDLLSNAAGPVRLHFYEGATHDFDDPGHKRQSVQANAEARQDAIWRATTFFARELSDLDD